MTYIVMAIVAWQYTSVRLLHPPAHAYTPVCELVHAHVRTHARALVQAHVRAHVHAHIHVHIDAQTHVCTHVYTQAAEASSC